MNNALKSVYSSLFNVKKVFLNFSYKYYDLSFVDNGWIVSNSRGYFYANFLK